MKHADIPSSEITPKDVYLSRRQFIQATGLLAGSLALAACGLAPDETAAETQAPSGITDELGDTATPLDDVLNYNNYYEFTTDKEGVARLSADFQTSPWDVEVYGLAAKPLKLSVDEMIRRFQPEERIYRLRCVEAWSMVIPWVGFPLAKLLPFVQKLVEGVGDFSPGDSLATLDIAKGKIGVLVCFEGIFPELSRCYVREGAQLLVNITNDGWYGRSSAPYQHLSMAVLRAVENGVPLVRAANTGISAIIDRTGKITHTTPLFKECFLAGEVLLGQGGTFYTRVGDVFALVSLGVSIIITLLGFRKSQGST